MAVDLSSEYSSKPVAFLEYPVPDKAKLPALEEYYWRKGRFENTWANMSPLPERELPFIMVDSGQYIHTGWHWDTQKASYRNMIDSELPRPVKGTVTALWERVGDHFNFAIAVTNQNAGPLSKSINDAEITALVYEDVTPDPFTDDDPKTHPNTVFHTNHYVRALAHQPINTPLVNGGTLNLNLSTSDIVDRTLYASYIREGWNKPINWNNLHGLVIVDYLAGGSPNKYDILQASPAVEGQLMGLDQDHLVFLQDLTYPTTLKSTLNVSGFPSTLTWTASSNQPWLKVAPATGGLSTPITVTVDSTGMKAGNYDGQITVNSMQIQKTVSVKVMVMETLLDYYMPLIGITRSP